MIYYYNKNGIGKESREEPDEKYIVRKRAIPRQIKKGFDSILIVDTENNKVYYKLYETLKHKLEIEIQVLKAKLEDSDYKTLKYTEGQLSSEEFEIVKKERQEWRNKINELEEELKNAENNNSNNI